MSPATVQSLNHLLAIHCRSFPQYLRWSRPHIPPGKRDAVETLQHVVQDQDQMARRIGQLISDAGYLPSTGEFPMEFTDTHDLDLDYVLRLAAGYQREDIADIETLVAQLQTSPAGKAAAEEALGMAKGHLEALTELTTAGV
jgi:hypothetical protein